MIVLSFIQVLMIYFEKRHAISERPTKKIMKVGTTCQSYNVAKVFGTVVLFYR